MFEFHTPILNSNFENPRLVRHGATPICSSSHTPFLPLISSRSDRKIKTLLKENIPVRRLNYQGEDNLNHNSTSQARCFEYLRRESFILDHPQAIRNQLQAITRISQPSLLTIMKRSINLPKNPHNRKTLVLDLDETLIHTSYPECSEVRLSGNPELNFSVRPYAKELLEFAAHHFEVIIFTASQRNYADRILDYLDPMNKFISCRLYRENCIITEKGCVKDLRTLGSRSLENIVFVDNCIISFAFQLENAIPILSWYGDHHDRELKKLIQFLRILECVDDVRPLIKSTFGLKKLLQ